MYNMSPQSAKEIEEILYFFPQEYLNKIPKEEVKYISSIKDNSYVSNIKSIEDINITNLSEDTKEYLGYIFLNYIATAQEKEEYLRILKDNQEKYQKELAEKYDINKVFDKRKISIENYNKNVVTDKAIIKYEENFIQKIINKIKLMFYKK